MKIMNMTYEVTISKTGSLTIPAAIKKELGIEPGQKVEQSLDGNRIILNLVAAVEMASKGEIRKNK